ncbi:50S ribosomal protein L6 [Candidatus Pelagibacter communis]|uniref:50S ribosomal protein L6 n=1 Tax=Pelagibacter ubique TaxID=198252 RepID=UPI00094D4B98|nr:50S ribosomal protein L6 [Candidatus Pelagibacter ubique]
MSKIGKINISIPDKVKVILSGSEVNIEGPLGKQSIKINLDLFDLKVNDGKDISLKPKKIDETTKRLWGMNRSLLNNAIIGSSVGFEKVLELSGVGYRAALKGNQLNLQLGFSHDINFDIPNEIKIGVEKQTTIKITGINKQKVGMVASKIKSFRPPEPYKGKGIREKGQYVLKKEGKKK